MLSDTTKKTDPSASVWNHCLDRLALQVQDYDFTTWIRPLKCQIHDRKVAVLAPNHYIKDWIQQHYWSTISALIVEQNSNWEPWLTIDAPASVVQKKKSQQPPPFFVSEGKDLTDREHTFSLYVEGRSNRLARSAALAVAEHPRKKGYNPLFIYGDSGLGKTHLLHAIANRYQEKRPHAKIAYTSSDTFLHNLVSAIRLNKGLEFSRFYRSHDILLMDDFQFLSGKSHSLDEFFSTFNILIQSGKQVVITSDRFHRDLPEVSDRLCSRLGSGLQVRIDPPEFETRVVILESKAQKLGLSMPEDAILFIAKRVRSNVRELEGVLHRIKAHHELFGEQVDLNLVQTLMQDLLQYQERQISIENIISRVAEHFSLRKKDLLSASRVQRITKPRQLAMYMAAEFTTLSLPAIGLAFGGRDHSTVVHARNKIKEQIKTDSQLQDDFSSIEKKLYW